MEKKMPKMSREELLREVRWYSDMLDPLKRAAIYGTCDRTPSPDPEFDRLMFQLLDAMDTVVVAQLALARFCRSIVEEMEQSQKKGTAP